jgi:hypothetical protein
MPNVIAVAQAWCAKFVFWCFEQAAKRTGVSNPLSKIWGAGQLESWALKNTKVAKCVFMRPV